MLGDKIIGTWSLISWTYTDQNGNLIDHIGKDPLGTLTFAKSGHMSVQIMKNNRKKFESGSLTDGTQEEIREAFTSFFSYFGTYEEKEDGVLSHFIIGSNFPNWVGETEIRYGKIIADTLTLSAPATLPDGQNIKFEVKWKRV